MLTMAYEHLLQRIRDRLPETTIYVMAYYPANDRDVEIPPMFMKMIRSRMEKLSDANAAVEKLCDKPEEALTDCSSILPPGQVFDDRRADVSIGTPRSEIDSLFQHSAASHTEDVLPCVIKACVYRIVSVIGA